MKISSLIALFCASTIIGCAYTSGKEFNMADADRLQPGVTTFDDAKLLLGGSPQSVVTDADGKFSAIWVHTRSTIGAWSNKAVGILFDKDGKMVRIVSRLESKNN